MMKKTLVWVNITIIVTFLLAAGCSGGLARQAAVSITETAMSLNATQLSLDNQATEKALQLQATQLEQERAATETPVSDEISNEVRMTMTANALPAIPPTAIPLAALDTVTPTLLPSPLPTLATPTEVTQTPQSSGPAGPTPTFTPVKGMAKVRIENRTTYDLIMDFVCVTGPCVGKTPNSYHYKLPYGVWFVNVWEGRYKMTIKYCGNKTDEGYIVLNPTWKYYLPASECK